MSNVIKPFEKYEIKIYTINILYFKLIKQFIEIKETFTLNYMF